MPKNIADLLEPYSTTADPAYGDLVTELVKAIRGGGDAARRFAQANIITLIPPEALVSKLEKRGRFAKVVRIVTALLFIAPVALTWWNLREALTDYDNLIRVRPEVGEQSFLTLWQDGFGGHGTSLSWVAIKILVALGLLALGLITTEVLDGRSGIPGMEVEQARATLLEAQVELAQYALAAPKEFTGELKNMAESFSKVGKDAERMTAVASSLFGTAAEATESLNEAVTSIDERYSSAFDAITDLEQVIGGLSSNAADLKESVAATSGGLQRSANSTDVASQAMSSTAERLGKQAERLGQQAEVLKQQTDGLASAAIDGVASWNQYREMVESTKGEVSKSAASLADIHQKALVTNLQMAGAAEQLVAEVRALRGVIAESRLDRTPAAPTFSMPPPVELPPVEPPSRKNRFRRRSVG